MTHPLDLHPLHETAQQAWNMIRQPQQPEYGSLPLEYRSRLLRHAENAQQGKFQEGEDPIVTFEHRVADLLAPPQAMAAPIPEEPKPRKKRTTKAAKKVATKKAVKK